MAIEEWRPTPVTTQVLEGHLEELDELDRYNVGRWGERLATAALRACNEFDSVRWVNEEKEQGLPYDIEAVRAKLDAPDGGDEPAHGDSHSEKVYLEVKTTTSHDKALFEISCAELDFMRRAGSSYELCRVWAAGTPNARVARLREPAAALASGQLALLIGASDVRTGGESKRQRTE